MGDAQGWLPLAIVFALAILLLAILIAWWLLGGAGASGGGPGPGSTSTGYGTPQPRPGGISVLSSALQVPGLSGFQVVGVGTSITSGTVSIGTDSADAAAFRGTLQGILTTLNGVVATPAGPAAINLGSLGNSVVSALDPTSTVVRRALSFVNLDIGLKWAPADPIEPIMAAPDFPQPMYAPLRDLSQEFLLPGVGQIPRESVGLLQPNLAFIECYMVGLNFEMGRQLLWNAYPTDQRGSYFRQFWDVSGYVPAPNDPPLNSPQLIEELKDISPINTWNPATDIGTHANPLSPASGSVLVLLIRGELLRRYPTTHVYAVPALLQTQSDGSVTRIPNPDQDSGAQSAISGHHGAGSELFRLQPLACNSGVWPGQSRLLLRIGAASNSTALRARSYRPGLVAMLPEWFRDCRRSGRGTGVAAAAAPAERLGK